MGLEFGEFTRLWLGREGGWEPVDGIAHIELEEERPPAEEPSPAQTEYTVKTVASWGPACPSGRHRYHPGYNCEEHEELSKAFQDFYERLFAEALAQAAQRVRRYQEAMDRFLEGLNAWEPRGLLGSLIELPEPTPIERALQILAPHLVHEPLYQPKARMARWFAEATDGPAPVSDQPSPVLTPKDRPAWQSPYGPVPRRR